MNRRGFFGAMAAASVLPAAVLAKLPLVFAAITHAECVPVCCDLSLYALLDAAGRINELAGIAPSVYRLTTGPWLYLYGKSIEIRDAMRKEYQADIVVVMDSAITDVDYWSLDAHGIKIWSPGV